VVLVVGVMVQVEEPLVQALLASVGLQVVLVVD
jgi:hypothetical protein